MKKLLTLLMVAGMFSLVACGPTEAETKLEEEKVNALTDDIMQDLESAMEEGAEEAGNAIEEGAETIEEGADKMMEEGAEMMEEGKEKVMEEGTEIIEEITE